MLRVLPPFSGGLHCGQYADNGPNIHSIVLPPFSGGLHCGSRVGLMMVCRVRVLPPFSGGLHCGKEAPRRAGVVVARAPAVQRRAPLRHHWSARASARKDRVLPPFSGGLHCGLGDSFDHYLYGEVLPPFSGGLHCGIATTVIPTDLASCSRRSAAGSIAAS